MSDITILVIDDEHAKDHKEHLETKGYLVESFSEGLKAMDSIKSGFKYDIAVIDLRLDDVDGLEVMKCSKEHNPRSLIICASGGNYKPKYADTLLVKPFKYSQLITLVKKLTSNK